jgi:hypothetical protein
LTDPVVHVDDAAKPSKIRAPPTVQTPRADT